MKLYNYASLYRDMRLFRAVMFQDDASAKLE